MNARRQLQQRLRSLVEMQEILGSMQTLAVLETHKLARYGGNQQRVVTGIERAAADLCRYFPQLLERLPVCAEVYLLLGSERGFCGDYNERLLDKLSTLHQAHSDQNVLVLAIGNRLCAKLANDPRVIARLTGPSATEEVPAVLIQVVDTLLDLENRFRSFRLTILYHDPQTQQVVQRPLLPPFTAFTERSVALGPPPYIHLPVQQLFSELVEHYLFAVLHALFYTALGVENQRRIQHLEAATRRLEEEITQLKLRANTLRQEEITEEIEVILLSAQERME
jgi:F-type H+-transporting ATPase subunit gamma